MPERLRVGVMFEVPAAGPGNSTACLPRGRLHFGGYEQISLQFLYAADRGNSFALSARYDKLVLPASFYFRCYILWSRRSATGRCGAGRVWRDGPVRPVESAGPSGDRRCAPCRWRLVPSGPVKAMIRSLDLDEATGFHERLRFHKPDRPLAARLFDCSLCDHLDRKFSHKSRIGFGPVMRASA